MKSKIKKIVAAVYIILPLIAFIPFVASAALVPCGGSEQEYAQKIANDPKATPAQMQALYEQYMAHSCQIADIFKLFARVTNGMVAFAGIYAIFRIVDNGFGMVTAFGNEETIKATSEGLTHAILGFLIVLGAYALVNTLFEIFGPNFGIAGSGFLFNPFTGK